MKKIFSLLFFIPFLFLLGGCSEEDPNEGPDPEIDIPLSTIEWELTVFDFGDISTEKEVSHKYYFTNTGDKEIKIYRVKPSCSCTAGEWSKEPVPPGGKGFVELKFDPKGKKGKVLKSAKVLMNTDPKYQELKFQAMIKE